MISTNYDTSQLTVVQIKDEPVPGGTECFFCLKKLFETAIKNQESLYACVDCVPEGSNNMGKIKCILNKQKGVKNQMLPMIPFPVPNFPDYYGNLPKSS